MGNSSFGKGRFDRKCSPVKESELVPCDCCPVCLQWNKRRNKIKLYCLLYLLTYLLLLIRNEVLCLNYFVNCYCSDCVVRYI